ncbi:MAG: carbamoyl-phosphate synthase (glutamine-hydrolyzing) small subunit, partial [Candidatus Pacebacteria bacterium]|nr:carbamoyl-phosphate synthase (glutamine-hydrolyzing) small subunit [Candidatus Paceibacterota bacterium]
MNQKDKLDNKKKKYPPKAIIVLEKGPKFEGYFFGKKKEAMGEVVFNTGMVGYPETLTDPSYRSEILVFTQPLIGNYGVPNNDKEFGLSKHFESDNIHIRGLIVSDYSFEHSHWSAIKSLDEWLKEHNIPGIYGIDTRELTKVLREQGTMSGCIQSKEEKKSKKWENESDKNFVAEVSTNKRIVYKKGPKKIILIDCGVKNNIIRSFLKRNIT